MKGSSVAEIVRMGDEHLATHPVEDVPSVPVDRFHERRDLDL